MTGEVKLKIGSFCPGSQAAQHLLPMFCGCSCNVLVFLWNRGTECVTRRPMGARNTTVSPTWGLGQTSLLAWVMISFVLPWAGCSALGWIPEGQ